MATKKTTTRGKKGSIRVDFTGVQLGGGSRRIPEGEYPARPIEATKEDGNEYPYIAWVYEITEGKYKGTRLYDNNSTSPKALWRLRNALEAMGIPTKEGPMDVDYEDICADEGISVILSVGDDDTAEDGKTRSKIAAVLPADGGEDGDKEEKEEVDFSEMDADDLAEFVKEHELDVNLKKLSTLSKKRKAVEEAYEASSEDDKSSKKNTKGGKGKKDDKDDKSDVPDEDTLKEMDEDELAEVVDEHNLDVDLEKFKTLSKKRAAVIEALEDAGDGDKGGDGDTYSEEDVNGMDSDDLEKLGEELEVELEGTTRKKRRAIIAALKEADRLSE